MRHDNDHVVDARVQHSVLRSDSASISIVRPLTSARHRPSIGLRIPPSHVLKHATSILTIKSPLFELLFCLTRVPSSVSNSLDFNPDAITPIRATSRRTFRFLVDR
jgi:hypothetical protein